MTAARLKHLRRLPDNFRERLPQEWQSRDWQPIDSAPLSGEVFDAIVVDRYGLFPSLLRELNFVRLMTNEYILHGRTNRISSYLVPIAWAPRDLVWASGHGTNAPDYILPKHHQRFETEYALLRDRRVQPTKDNEKEKDQ